MAKADAIEHTHIWIDKYDNVNHWQECSICKIKQNIAAHTFEDHWYVDNNACGGKSSHKVCSCGYAYTYRPPHIKDPTWNSSTATVRVHFRTCKNCGHWMEVGECYNENGPLSCKNPGKCSLCNGTWTTGKHFLQGGGMCRDCKQKFYTITNKTQIYSTDYKICDCSFDVVPESGVEVTGSTMFPSGTTNYSNSSTNLKKNADGTYTIKWHFVLDENRATKILYPAWRYNNVKVNGYYCYVIEDAMFSIWMDHTAPAVTNIIQTNQTSHDGWATAKRLDINGTEDYADIVDISIIDKTTQHVVVSNAKAGVTDKKWSYTCTPDLEGGKTGRVYTIRTEDVNGNVSNTDFTVYNTDSASPQIESPLSYTDWTNTAKTITLMFTDYGSGDVQASLDNQTSYKACTKTADGKYQITYTFSDDIIGNKTYKLYLRDGLGNAGSYDLVVGNIDKNTYSITYNLNGGTMSGQKTSYTVADSFTLPTPTKTGYTFTGWTGSNGATSQKTVTVNKGTRGNLNYTANWSANQYLVTFNGNGGSLNIIDETIAKNNNGTATAKVQYDANNYYILGIMPTRQGYTFKGFYDAPSGGIQVFKPYDTANCLSVASKYYNENNIWKYAGNVTLYAQWTPITWTVKYDANGGTGTMADSKHVYESGSKLKQNQFSKTGYTFNGWQASRVKDGKTEWLCANTDNSWIDGNEWYEKDKIPSNRKIFYFYDCQIMQISTYIDGDVITMHALWNVNTYANQIGHWAEGFKYREGNNDNKNALRLKDTYFSASYKSNIVMDSAKAVKIPNGYYLRGLGTPEVDGTFKAYSIGLKLIQKPVSMRFEYYYDPISYSITYNLNGGTNNNANPSTYTVLYGVNLKAPTRAGYAFTGWYDENGNKITGINEGCNATFSSADDLYSKLAARTTGNRVLTAHWSYNPISVKVPQILIGDHTGKSQFRVKCDDFKAGSIKVTVPNSFLYKQTGNSDVTATITSKSGNNTITPTNKVCVYDITTKNGLSAGCWQGSFNIGLTLTKE